MTHVHDTFFVLEDGTKANPNDVAADDKGVLRHSNGGAVAMRGDVPRTSGTNTPAALAPEQQAKRREAEEAKAAAAAKDREMKAGADDSKGYRTRGR